MQRRHVRVPDLGTNFWSPFATPFVVCAQPDRPTIPNLDNKTHGQLSTYPLPPMVIMRLSRLSVDRELSILLLTDARVFLLSYVRPSLIAL